MIFSQKPQRKLTLNLLKTGVSIIYSGYQQKEMIMKFRFVNLILILIIFFSVSGCGDSSSKSTSTDGSYTAEPSSPNTPDSDSELASSQQQIVPDIEVGDLQEVDNFHITMENLEVSEDGYVEYEFESAIFSTRDCYEDSNYLRGFSIEIPSNTSTLKLSNLNGFINTNKIGELTTIVINSHNKILVQKSYSTTGKEKDILISELEAPAYLVIYSTIDHDSKKCKKLNTNNFKVSFYAQSY